MHASASKSKNKRLTKIEIFTIALEQQLVVPSSNDNKYIYYNIGIIFIIYICLLIKITVFLMLFLLEWTQSVSERVLHVEWRRAQLQLIIKLVLRICTVSISANNV